MGIKLHWQGALAFNILICKNSAFNLLFAVNELTQPFIYHTLNFFLSYGQKNKWDFFLFLVLEVLAMLITGSVALTSEITLSLPTLAF